MLRYITLCLSILSMISAMASGAAPEHEAVIRREGFAAPVISDSLRDMAPFNRDVVFKTRPASRADGDWLYKDVTVAAVGTLAEAVGEELYDLDSIAVRGIIGKPDFYTLWSASFYGNLSVINLEEAEIENGIVPDEAFWHNSEQEADGGAAMYVIRLRKIMFPSRLKSIGQAAFAYVIHLEEIGLPKELESMGIYCFSDCISLSTSPLRLPEGLTEVPGMCFKDCKSLNEVVLPSTVKKLGEGAFYSAKLKHIDMPDGLQSISGAAFYATEAEEFVLPSSCTEFDGWHNFALNHKLKQINIPYGTKVVSSGFALNDIELLEIDIPSTVEVIKDYAFWECSKLEKITLHEGLREIWDLAFYYCRSVKQLVLPSTLTYIGGAAFQNFRSLEAIYCSAIIPPACDDDPEYRGEMHTFGPITGEITRFDTPKDIPVYVPIGTAALYASAYGWDYFTNYIETDDFPAGVEDITTNKAAEGGPIYDLQGRKAGRLVEGEIYVKDGRKFIYRQ